jgi:hypothetical protein
MIDGDSFHTGHLTGKAHAAGGGCPHRSAHRDGKVDAPMTAVETLRREAGHDRP